MGVLRLLTFALALGAGLAAQNPTDGPPAAPLPDREAFFAEARRRLASNDLIQSRYSYRERTTELRFNPFGRLGTGPELIHDVYPHPNDELTYRRLIARDGHAVPAEELARQDHEYRRRLAAWNRRLAGEGRSERLERERKAREAREKDQALAREAVSLFDFAIIGRDTWEGQPAIVVSFTPRADAEPRSREGRVARAFAGRAWIHEHEYEVMRVEARAIDDVSFGWGVIGRLYEGATARFTRRRINGVWVPVESRFDGDGRALLVRRLTIRFERDYCDYRPFEPSELPERLGWPR